MGIRTGMRGKDLKAILMVARQYHVIMLIRHTNDDSLKYVGQAGFYPKPAVVKAKTADKNPTGSAKGLSRSVKYNVAGLVVHPGFQPDAYAGAKKDKAVDCWEHTMAVLAPALMKKTVDIARPETFEVWGVERQGVNAPRWYWRVDIDPLSERFGCLQLKTTGIPWSYIHGDYDLKDVIVVGHEQVNQRIESSIDGVKNFMPLLKGLEFETIQRELNGRIGADMIQHGSEAQFAWHGDEPITVAYPDWRHEILLSPETVQSWYMQINREVLGTKGRDWLRDSSRIYHYGPHGLFKPGCLPGQTWG